MTKDLVSCAPGADAHEVSLKMQEGQARRVLVVEDGSLRGVISTADLARASSESGRDGSARRSSA